MPNTLTTQQIEALYSFTKQHYVDYYDLQTELVDHLANAIETQWEFNPNLDFYEALQIEFKKFGVFGFSDVVTTRKKALGKKYQKLLSRYFIHFFKLPLILITLPAIFVLYKIIQLEPLVYVPLVISIQGASFVKVMWLKKKYNAKVAITKRRWLLEEIIYKASTVVGFMGVTMQFIQFTFQNKIYPAILVIMPIVLVVTALHNYVVLFVIPSKAKEHLKNTYPDYDLDILC